jgi:hypothetical protein
MTQYGDDIQLTLSGGEHPLPGRHPAVCIDVQLLGLEPQRDGSMVEKMQLWFELSGPRQADGMPFFVKRKFSTKLSTHKNAALIPFLTGWRGRPFTPAELQAFRIISVVGQPCILTLAQSVPDMAGNSWTNIVGIEPSPNPVQPSGRYVRRPPKARQPYQQPYSQQPAQQYGQPVQQPQQGYPQPYQQQGYQQLVQQAYLPASGYTVPQPQQQPAQQGNPSPTGYAVPAPAQSQNQQTPSAPAPATQPAPSPITGPTAHTPDNSKLPF